MTENPDDDAVVPADWRAWMKPPVRDLRTRRAAPLAFTAWAVAMALVLGEVGIRVVSGERNLAEPLTMAAVVAAFATLGAGVAVRRQENAIGWLFLAVALLGAVRGFASSYAIYGLVIEPGRLPGAVWMAWLWNWAWWVTLALPATFLLLLFPDGRLPSRRWRSLAWACGVVVIVPALLMAALPGSYEEQGLPAGITNPLGVGALEPRRELIGGAMFAALGVLTVACAASLILRFVRSRGDERQQLKWVAYASALFVGWLAVGSVVDIPEQVDDALLAATTLLWAGALGTAILRYRLYDIDRIISRTVSYALLTGLLIAVYLGVVFALQQLLRPITGESQLAVAGATLAVAALFGPARRRVQAAVDRRFNRARYDAQRTVDEFRARLRDEVDLDQLGTELVGAVRSTVQPEQVSMWLRPREGDAHS